MVHVISYLPGELRKSGVIQGTTVVWSYGVAVYLTSPCCSLQTQQALSEHHSIRQQLKQKPLEESESSDRLVYQ